MKRLLLTTLFLALSPLAVLADTPPPDTAPAPVVAPSDCKKPTLAAPKMTRDTGNHDMVADAQAYLDCVKAYATQEKAAALAHGSAANKAITDYNDFVKEYDEYQQSHH